MEFVDRIDEMARLKAALNRTAPSFVAIYGRRRVGKSALIQRVLGDGDIYYLATEVDAALQRELVAKTASSVFEGLDIVSYNDWESLLLAINFRVTEKFTLCFDEFPYMVRTSPELPSVIQKMVDSHVLKYNLIVCGSSQQSMYSLLLDSTSPIYGRADLLMKVNPLRIPFIQEALQLNPIESVENFAVLGGVPRYWCIREAYGSLEDMLWSELFHVNGTLYEEAGRLLRDDVKDPVKASTILSYVGTGSAKVSEIASRCGEPSTNLSRPLAKLIELGYLKKDIPFGENEKNAKKSLYKVSDSFFGIYYKYLVPFRSFIEMGRTVPLKNAFENTFSDYVGMVWEDICRDAVSGNVIDGVVYGKASRWWRSVNRDLTVEVDVVAESVDHSTLLVGECKWTNEENAMSLLNELEEKVKYMPFAAGRKIVPVLFLKKKPQHPTGFELYPVQVLAMSR